MRIKKIGLVVLGLLGVALGGAALMEMAWVYVVVAVGWLVLMWIYRGESRNAYLLALGCLAGCLVFLVTGFYSVRIADNLALLVLLFLVLGAGQEILEEIFGWQKLNFGGEILVLIQQDLGRKKIWRPKPLKFEKRLLGKLWRGWQRWPKQNKQKLILGLMLGVMSWQVLIGLRFAWWFYGRAYIKQFLILYGLEILWVGGWYLAVGLLFFSRDFRLGKKLEPVGKIIALLAGVGVIVFTWGRHEWQKTIAARPMIFEVIRVGIDAEPKAAIRGSVFDRVKEGKVYFNGEEMTADNWTHDVVTVPLPPERASEFFAAGQRWQIIDTHGTASEVFVVGQEGLK